MTNVSTLSADASPAVPSKAGMPLLGVLPEIFGKDPFEYLKNTMLEHGDLVRLNFATQPVYLASHPDHIQHILRDNYQNYRKPDMFYSGARELAGNGLVTSSGDFWLRQRRMIQPHLHRKQLAALFSAMVEATADVLEGWRGLVRTGAEIELGEEVAEITINVITRTMFGKNTIPAEAVAETNRRAKRLIEYIGRSLYTSVLPRWLPMPGRRQFKEDLNAFYETVSLIIAECSRNRDGSANLIQMLLDSVDEETNAQMTQQQLFDETVTIFLAGYETTATALTWLGVVLDRHPEILAGLRAEIDQVLGTRPPSFEDVGRLAYTRRVFMELLRMYTVVPLLPRALNAADRLGRYDLPANALVLVFYHGVHHNPRVWDKPEVFDPDRFLPERLAQQHAFAYLPFSAGPRKCAGDEFALLEGPLVMAMMLQQFNLNVVPNQSFVTRVGTTMRPARGVRATLSER